MSPSIFELVENVGVKVIKIKNKGVPNFPLRNGPYFEFPFPVSFVIYTG